MMPAALLRCVCVYDWVTGCLYITLACLDMFFYLCSAVYQLSTGWSQMKSYRNRSDATHACAVSCDRNDSLPLSLLLSICLYCASQV